MIKTLYRTWFEFTMWLCCLVGWIFCLQGELNWKQPLLLWALFMFLYFLTKSLGFNAGALPFMALLTLISWIFLTRLDPAWANRQFNGVLIALIAYLLCLWQGTREFKYPLLWAIGALGVLLITALFGVSVGGAKAWLKILGLRFQPVELGRIFLIIYLAQYFTEKRPWWELLLILTGFFSLLVWQRDLGPALLVFLVFCWMSLHFKYSWKKLLLYLALTIIGFCVAYLLFPHFQNRGIAWLWPWDYTDSKGYQVLQGLFALRGGGLIGEGLGQGYVHVIPNHHTDYLLTVIGEEFGFLGTFSLLAIYFSLAFWALHLLQGVQNKRLQMIGFGLTLLLHVQTFLVVGGILRLVPFTGLTLPLISYGSTSLVAEFAMLGLVTGLGRERGEG